MFAVIYSCQKEQQTVVVGPFRSDLPIMIRQVSLHAASACKQGSVAHIVVAADLLAIAVPPFPLLAVTMNARFEPKCILPPIERRLPISPRTSALTTDQRLSVVLFYDYRSRRPLLFHFGPAQGL